MDLILNPFALTLIITGLLVGITAIYITYLVQNATSTVGATMFCAGIWGFFYGLELASTDLETMLIFIKFEYIGIVLLGSFWLFFTLKYTKYTSSKLNSWFGLSFIIPVISYVMLVTNEYHFWFYSSVELSNISPFPTAVLGKGPFYYLNMVYLYLMFLLGTAILFKRFRHADDLFLAQTRLILIAILIPLGFNAVYQTGIYRPFEVIDLTPFGFLIGYLIIGFAVLKYNLFGIKPIAHGKIIEAITKGVLVMNDRFQIVDYNPALKHFLKNPSLLKTGMSAHMLFEGQPEIQRLLKSKNEKTTEVDFVKQDKKNIFNVESIYLYENKFVLTGMILLFDDITEQRLLTMKLTNQTQELQQLNDLKDKYFSIISHDLRGPIFGVRELLHLAQTDIISTEELVKVLPEMSRNMEQVALLLENLLAWATSQIRGEQLQPSSFDVNSVIQDQCTLLMRIASQKDIEISVSAGDRSMVFADKNMVELIVRNLVSNAVKFSEKNSQVKVSSELSEDHVKICIQDFGIGISPEYIQKIEDGTSFTTIGSKNEAGTGLGLLLVKEYVEKNKGTLFIYSQEGKGSKFCFTLPLDVN